MRRGATVLALVLAGLGIVDAGGASAATPGPDGRGPLSGDPAHPGDLAGTVLDLAGEVRDLNLTVESLDGSVGVSGAGPRTTVRLATDVLFAFGKATLTPAARVRIAEAATALRQGGATGSVEVEGHTDHVGTAAYNQDLSLRRARAVAAALGPLLADPRITLVPRGYGFTRPLIAERTSGGADDPRARARNRRVAIVFSRPTP